MENVWNTIQPVWAFVTAQFAFSQTGMSASWPFLICYVIVKRHLKERAKAKEK